MSTPSHTGKLSLHNRVDIKASIHACFDNILKVIECEYLYSHIHFQNAINLPTHKRMSKRVLFYEDSVFPRILGLGLG